MCYRAVMGQVFQLFVINVEIAMPIASFYLFGQFLEI